MYDTIAFRVVGERKNDPAHLLVVDDDGQHYDYDLLNEEIAPVSIDSAWKLDVITEESHLIIEAPTHRIAS